MKNFFNLQRFTTVVSLTANDDYYSNAARPDRIIYGLEGDDTISNAERSDDVTIYGGMGNDSIENLYSLRKRVHKIKM